MKHHLSLVLGALLPLLHSHAAHAGGYNPWGSITPSGTLALSPYLAASADGTLAASPYALLAVGDRNDVMVGGTGTVGPAGGDPSPALTSAELMPRLRLADALIVAPHLIYIPEGQDLQLAAELHGLASAGRLTATWNLGWRTALTGEDQGPGAAFLLFAPEINLGDGVSIFTEVDPTLALDSTGRATWATTVVPGLTVLMDPEGRHSLTLAMPTSLAGAATTPALGLLYGGLVDLRRTP